MEDDARKDTTKGLTIIIAGGFDRVIQSLKDLLELESDFSVIGSATNEEETVIMLEQMDPDVVVMGLMRNERQVLDLARRVNLQFPATGLVFISVYTDGYYRAEAARAGVREYVSLTEVGQALAPAVRSAAKVRSGS